MSKEIKQTELYQAPLCKEYLLATRSTLLNGSPDGNNPGGYVNDLEEGGSLN